jgi:hypothetical protein
MVYAGVYVLATTFVSQQLLPCRNTSITVLNGEQEEKRQQHDILYRILQTVDESEQYWWWFCSWQICVHGSEGKSSIIVHQGVCCPVDEKYRNKLECN